MHHPPNPLPVNPDVESLWYEAIWATIKGVRLETFATFLQHRRPSEASALIPEELLTDIKLHIAKERSKSYHILLRGQEQYPASLDILDLPVVYYRGNVSLLQTPCVAIVGSRKASPRGLAAARRIAQSLTADGYTIVSGLAAGIDTAAHKEALRTGHQTIAVIGTPINKAYPRENTTLQEQIAVTNLLLSHVPFYKYAHQDYKQNSRFFPERNKVMAALSAATIIAEASDTSGSLIQAREALRLKKKVILLKPTYDNPNLSWPKTYVQQRGAFVADTMTTLKQIIGEAHV